MWLADCGCGSRVVAVARGLLLPLWVPESTLSTFRRLESRKVLRVG